MLKIKVSGLVGTTYSLRHDFGFFRAVAVTGTYQVASDTESVSSEQVVSAFETALRDTVKQLPALQLSIKYDSEASPEAVFIRHREISLDQVLSFQPIQPLDSDVSSKEGRDASLVRTLQRIHESLFTDLDRIPSWRLLVLNPNRMFDSSMPPGSTVDAIFYMHHAIGDGLSAVAFHRKFTKNLSTHLGSKVVATSPNRIVNIKPGPFEPQVWMENVLPPPHGIKIDHTDRVRPQVWPEAYKTHPRYAEDDHPSETGPLACIRLLEVPEDHLKGLVKLSKKHGITATGYLHGVVCGFVARHDGGSHSAIVGDTPFSMRKFTNASKDDIVNHFSVSQTTYASSLTDRFRKCLAGSAEDMNLIVEAAKAFTTDLKKDLDNYRQPKLIGLSAFWLPSLAAFEGQLPPKPSNQISYELSNLGIEPVAATTTTMGGSPLLRRLIFSQCGFNFRADIMINCVSLEDGPMTMTFSWENGKFDASLADALKGDIRSRCAAATAAADSSV